MTKSFSLQNKIAKGVHDEVIYFSNTYIYIYLQTQPGDRAITQSYTVQQPHTGSNIEYNESIFLNLSMGDKQNYVVIINPKINKENMNIYIRKRVCANSGYTYIHIFNIYSK